MRRLQPAAEQAAHPKSGPRRRPDELLGSFVTHGDFRRTTHTNCSPRFPARFSQVRLGDLLGSPGNVRLASGLCLDCKTSTPGSSPRGASTHSYTLTIQQASMSQRLSTPAMD